MDIMYSNSDIRPQFFTFETELGRKKYTINYGVEEIKNAEDGQKFRFQSITLQAGEYDYGTVISAIIHSRYSDDEMQAIINNYLLDEENEETLSEFLAMQEYRKFAKSVASDFTKAISEE